MTSLAITISLLATFLCGSDIAPPAPTPPKDHVKAPQRKDDKQQTPRAIAEALAWLAAHQRPDGMWDRRHFDRLCPPRDRCSQTALDRIDQDADVGVTALAALAFLGAGYNHRQGPYADNLNRAFEYILNQQDSEGSFAAGSRLQIFNDAIATLAVEAAYAATKDPTLRKPLERAVRHLEQAQQTGGAWDYTADISTHRNDTSVLGWVVMALEAAQTLGVLPADATRFAIIDHLDWATEPDGRVRHANKGHGTPIDKKTGRPIYRYGPAMTAIGLYSRAVLALRLDAPLAQKQVRRLLHDPPSVKRLHTDPTGLHSQYYWFFGTLALHEVGGHPWKQWKGVLRSTLLESQQRPVDRKGRHRHAYGSWPAFGPHWGKWGRVGGRIYSTAINTLTLEAYYEYPAAYLAGEPLIGPLQMRRRLARLGSSGHVRLLRLAIRLEPDTGEPILLDLLHSPNEKVSIAAAIALADLGSPMGKAILQAKRAGPSSAPDATLRRRIDNALARLAQPITKYTYGKVTQVNAPAQMFLFETGGRPLYYGQRLSVLRDGRIIGTAQVKRRFSKQKAAAARIEAGAESPQPGDLVTSRKSE